MDPAKPILGNDDIIVSYIVTDEVTRLRQSRLVCENKPPT